MIKSFAPALYIGFLLLTCFLPVQALSQQQGKTIQLNGKPYRIKCHSVKSEYNSLDSVCDFFAVGNRHSVFRFYTYRFEADCNNEFYDHGRYTVYPDSIVFITDFKQKQSDPIPVWNKQVYQALPDGRWQLTGEWETGPNGQTQKKQ